MIVLLPLSIFGQDLTGVWKCNDGGTYYLRQVNKQLWWFGDGGPNWTNVFNGEIMNDGLTGVWADVPKGADRNSGTLGIIIKSSNRLESVKQTGGFSGNVWTRKGSRDIPDDNSYKYYPNSSISGHNKKILSVSLSECKSECLKYEWCKSFDFDPKAKKCFLQEVDISDVSKLRDDNKYDHYQNLCWPR